MRRLAMLSLLLVAASCGNTAWAQQAASSSGDLKRGGAVLADMAAGTFIDAHPDLHFRHVGMVAYRDGHKREAFDHFLIASRYADKASQAIVALIYWAGGGAPHDRPLAFAWMELAASRGYAELQHQHDLYWAPLNDEEHDQARDLRLALDVGYGGESATGLLGGAAASRDMSSISDSVRLNTAQYLQMKDLQWQVQMLKGRIDVGDPGPIRPPAS
jgi:TPR repeat protein